MKSTSPQFRMLFPVALAVLLLAGWTNLAAQQGRCPPGRDRLSNTAENIGESELMLCIRYGHTQEALALLRSGAELEATDRISRTALAYAIFTANEAVFDALIDRGAVIEVPWHVEPHLFGAVSVGNVHMVETLLTHGADSNAVNDVGTSVLAVVARDGDTTMARVLLTHGADPEFDSGEEFSGGPPFVHAVGAGQLAMVSLFLDAGVDVNNRGDYQGHSALWTTACRISRPQPVPPSRYRALARLLLERGADVDARDAGGYGGTPNDGRTPLMCAVVARDVELVELFIAAGADVNAKTWDRGADGLYLQSILQMAIETGNDVIVNLLLEAGATR